MPTTGKSRTNSKNKTERGEGGIVSRILRINTMSRKKGFFHTEETKTKISLINIGRRHTPETCIKISLAKKLFNNPLWKGDGAGKPSKHMWIKNNYGSPSHCEMCGKIGKKLNGRWNIDWSNINHQYRRTREDYQGLCCKCHCKYDKEKGLRFI